MELRQLRYFVAIADAGSFSKAAHQVYVAQPALSQQVAALETELKTKLLVRSSHGVSLTQAGNALYRHARSMLRQVERVREEISQPYSGETGVVALGLPGTVASLLALPLLKTIHDRHPGIFLHLFESMNSYLEEFLANGRMDMCMLLRDVETPGVALQRLVDEDMFLIGGPLGKNRGKSARYCKLAELDGVPMVLPSRAQGLRTIVERAFAQANVTLNIAAEIDSFRTLYQLSTEGFAHTILPSSALPRGFERRRFVRRIVEPGVHRPISLCWSTSLPRTAAGIVVQRTIVELVENLVRSNRWTGVRLRTTETLVRGA